MQYNTIQYNTIQLRHLYSAYIKDVYVSGNMNLYYAFLLEWFNKTTQNKTLGLLKVESLVQQKLTSHY